MSEKEKRQAILSKALGGLDSSHRKLTYRDLCASEYYDEILNVYRRLGGILPVVPCNLKKGDIVLPDIIVELDEEQHFNRYRLVTLESPLYNELEKFPLDKYRSYCKEQERACRTDGGFWTSKPCEAQFGKAGERGILDGMGAPRWKQRAFYDFLKDFSGLIIGTQYVRVSIYDKVKASGLVKTVDHVIRNREHEGIQAITEIIMDRKY